MEISVVIGIIVGVIVIGSAVVGFFNMQTRQNMKICQLEKEISELKEKQSKAAHYQIATEKSIIEINTKLDHIVATLDELKQGGCRNV